MDILEEYEPETLDELIKNIQELELEVGDYRITTTTVLQDCTYL